MYKLRWLIVLLGLFFVLSGCTQNVETKSKIAVTVNKHAIASTSAIEATPSDKNIGTESVTSNPKNDDQTKDVPFDNFFRGFITLKNEQAKVYPHGTYIIKTDEGWHEFMDKYVPGIPYYIPVNFSKEYLVFSVLFPARPTYSTGADIDTFKVKKGILVPEYKSNETSGISNSVYAQNIDGIEHVYVNIVKINKKYIPEDIKNIYHKGDSFK